ncbi:EamA family transporter [bacterium]|nr:EamA family transporter [bacterium]
MKPIDYLGCILVAALWGGNFVAAKIAMAHYPPIMYATIRFGGVALMLAPFMRWPDKKRWKDLNLFALTLGTLYFPFTFKAINMGLDLPTAILTSQMGVPFSCVMGVVLLKDKLGPWRSMGLMIAFIGLLVIAGSPNLREHMLAFWFMLIGAFFWSLSNIYIKRFNDMKIYNVLGWACLLSAPQLLVLSLIFEDNALESLKTTPFAPAMGMLYSIVGSTVIAYGLWYRLLSKHKVNQVVPFSLLVPFFGISAGVIMLNEPLTLNTIIGGLITLAGVGTIVIRKPKMFRQQEP